VIKHTQPQSLDNRSVHAGQTITEPRAFRDALGHYASGVTIIAGHDGVEPLGFTCQSFYSVSLTPPLISFSVMSSSSTYPRIRETGKFSVNVLAHAQKALADQFSWKGNDRWAGVAWRMTLGRNPVIAGALVWLDCKIHAEHEAGDHLIVLGQVIEMSADDPRGDVPLLYFKGKYRHLRELDGSVT
jgi:3-hydroxy-9,10-secoandrosta-1,3,5(10)-triene-9,17-dione monooxygenase reductase component